MNTVGVGGGYQVQIQSCIKDEQLLLIDRKHGSAVSDFVHQLVKPWTRRENILCEYEW